MTYTVSGVALISAQYNPIISQPQCGRCHRAGTGQTTLEVIGSKWSLHTELAQAEQ